MNRENIQPEDKKPPIDPRKWIPSGDKSEKPALIEGVIMLGRQARENIRNVVTNYLSSRKNENLNEFESDSEKLLIKPSIGLSSPEPTSEDDRTSIRQLELLENENLERTDKERIISETPKQLQQNSCVLASLAAVEANVFMKDIESPKTLERIRIDLATKSGYYAKKKGIARPNAEKLVVDLKYKVFHPQDGSELLKMLKSGDKGAIVFVKHEDERNHAVAVRIDKETGKLIISNPDSNPALSQEDRTKILSATEDEIQKLITNKSGESTLGNVLVIGDVNSTWEQPKTNVQEKDQSIVKPKDWLTEKEGQINERVSRLKTGRKQGLDTAFKEARLHIDERVLQWTEDQLNEFYDQQRRPQAETLKGQLKRSYNRGLKDAFDIDLKRAIVSLYLSGQVKKTAFGGSDNPEGSTDKRAELQEQISEETKWANGEYRIGSRKLSQVSVIFQEMNPLNIQETDIKSAEDYAQDVLEEVFNIANQLKKLGTTNRAEENFLRTVGNKIINQEYSQEFLDLITKWLEKDSDTDQERGKKISLQQQFKQGFQSIAIKHPPQQEIKKLENLAHTSDHHDKMRNILNNYKIPNRQVGHGDRLITQSIDSIINALTAGLKVSEINDLNSSRVFNLSDTPEKSTLQKQLIQVAIEYATITKSVDEEKAKKMRLNEYAESTDEDRDKIREIIRTSELSIDTLPDTPYLKTQLEEIARINASIEKIKENNVYPYHSSVYERINNKIGEIANINDGIVEHIQQNIDEIADLYRSPKNAKKMGSNNFVSQIVGIYLDRLSKNIGEPPEEFGDNQKNKLNSLREKLQSGPNKDTNLVFDAQREALGKIDALKDEKKRMEWITTNPYLKYLRRGAATREFSYLENVDVIAREEDAAAKSKGKPKFDALSIKPKEEELERAREDLYKLYEKESQYLENAEEKGLITPADDLKSSLLGVGFTEHFGPNFDDDKWKEYAEDLRSDNINKIESTLRNKFEIRLNKDGIIDDEQKQKEWKAILKWMRRYKKTPQWSPRDIKDEKHLKKYRDEHSNNETGDSGQMAA